MLPNTVLLRNNTVSQTENKRETLYFALSIGKKN